MLVLSRRREEQIVITVVDIRGDKVRLGIEASAEVPVHRTEVYDAIQRQKNVRQKVRPIGTLAMPSAPSEEACHSH